MNAGRSAGVSLSCLSVFVAVVSTACTAVDGDPRCDISEVTLAVQAVDRKLLGVASPYPADFMLRERADMLHRSQRLRRQVAWTKVARVLSPVELAETLPTLPGNASARVPRFQTWYGRDDLNRLFIHLYDGLGPDGRRVRARFDERALDESVMWNANMLDELDNWPEERWLAYIEAIDDASDVAGIGGIGRVLYSPSAARHLLESYPQMLDCQTDGAPAAYESAEDGALTRQLVREPVQLASCDTRIYGPYFVAGEQSLIAQLEGDVSGATVSISRMPDDVASGVGDASLAQSACRAHGNDRCSVTGPGGVYVHVQAGAADIDRAVLRVDYDESRPTWSACLQAPFAGDAAVVKTEWRRAQFGRQLPVYDTSAERMAQRLVPGQDPDWADGDGEADPGPDEIHTLTLPNGNRFRLAGMHIMTKELDHWLWITLWWSPEPTTDFGADRPATIRALGGPWTNYKMCVVTIFAESDPDPTGGFADTAPSLAHALAAVHTGEGNPSWCSNPYIENGAGNAGTNCIGCHQHGGTDMDFQGMLTGPTALPAHGRTQVRNNFPTDYSWAVNAGDRLDRMFADVVDYYDGFERNPVK